MSVLLLFCLLSDLLWLKREVAVWDGADFGQGEAVLAAIETTS